MRWRVLELDKRQLLLPECNSPTTDVSAVLSLAVSFFFPNFPLVSWLSIWFWWKEKLR